MTIIDSVKPFQPISYNKISNDARGQCQLIALANDSLRRSTGVKMIEQEKYLRANDVRLNRLTLCRWRNKWKWLAGSHNYRFYALCHFWGLTFEDMLAIGREELARVQSLPAKVKRIK